MQNCPICRIVLSDPAEIVIIECERCGRFELNGAGAGDSRPLAEILTDPGPNERRRANLSHKVRRRTREGQSHVLVRLAELDRWGLDDPLPTPTALLDELILWVGDNASAYSEPVPVGLKFLAGWLGLALDHPDRPDRGMAWLLSSEATGGLVQIADPSGPLTLKLSWDGWERHNELRRRDATSFTAFMAMKFGLADINAVVDDHFKPAVAATGFALKRVTDGQSAGLIDDQMRVGLRTSRFVIADLTHASRGSYWKGGFAEGLSKPVIYTCRKDHWEKEGSHFDTNHLATVVWDPIDLAPAVAALKAMIRATLPAVAKMTD